MDGTQLPRSPSRPELGSSEVGDLSRSLPTDRSGTRGRAAGGQRALLAAGRAVLAQLLPGAPQEVVGSAQERQAALHERLERPLHAPVRGRVALLLAAVAQAEQGAEAVRFERDARVAVG